MFSSTAQRAGGPLSSRGAHRPAGVGSRPYGSPILPGSSERSVSAYMHRHHHCGLSPQQAGGGRGQPPLSTGAETILLLCHERGLTLRARHVPGERNILADTLRRTHMTLSAVWSLSRDVLLSGWEPRFRPQVALFALAFSHRLPLYVSPVPDLRTLAMDALSVDWSGMIGYAFSPFPITAKVRHKASSENATLILVASRWPAHLGSQTYSACRTRSPYPCGPALAICDNRGAAFYTPTQTCCPPRLTSLRQSILHWRLGGRSGSSGLVPPSVRTVSARSLLGALVRLGHLPLGRSIRPADVSLANSLAEILA